jgi:hypothetical protein
MSQSCDVFLGFLSLMNPEGHKRFGYKCKQALFQKMKPHFHIDEMLVSFVKASGAICSSEHHDRWFAYQITKFNQTAVDDFRPICREIPSEM